MIVSVDTGTSAASHHAAGEEGRQDAAGTFSLALRQLYEDAGSPTLSALAHEGAAHRPPVRLALSSLSDWLNGRSLPASEAAVALLVAALSAQAVQRGRKPSGEARYRALYLAARAEASANHSGRRGSGLHRADMPAGPWKDLRDLLYELYIQAGKPTLSTMQSKAEAADDLPSAPGKDTIHRVITGRVLPTLEDAVTLAVMLARFAGLEPGPVSSQVRSLWSEVMPRADRVPPPRPGRPISQYDPFTLEVHPAIPFTTPDTSRQPLTTYVEREHDALLRKAIAEVQDGSSRMAVVVGGASTGKTRACWEAIQVLPGDWQLWHPIDPSRPEAAVEGIRDVGPRTVLWFNEAQFYLNTPGRDLGERLAAGLRTLLADRRRGPVLILATMWPEHWLRITTRPAVGAPDPFAQARELLVAASTVTVAEAFSREELAASRNAADPRVRHAAAHSESGQVTQYLAGAPQLLQRYQMAPPAARAIIHVAIDARRYGHPAALPLELLKQAAPGYLTDSAWDQLGEDWLEQALAYTSAPSYGTRGPLTRVRPRPGRELSQPAYQLADYLEQVGRTSRAGIFPPPAFWTAVTATVTDPEALCELGDHALFRGRFQRAADLYLKAAESGDADALADLGRLLLVVGRAEDGEDLIRQALTAGSTAAMEFLGPLLAKRDHQPDGENLLLQAAADGSSAAMRELALLRGLRGDLEGGAAIAIEAARHGDTWPLRHLAQLAERSGHLPDAAALYSAAAGQGDSESARVLQFLAALTASAGNTEALHQQASERSDTWALRRLAEEHERAGDLSAAEVLYRNAADLGDPHAATALALLKVHSGDLASAQNLFREAADQGETSALMHLAQLLAEANDPEQAETLYRQALDHGELRALTGLATLRQRLGNTDAAERLLRLGLTDDESSGAPQELVPPDLLRRVAREPGTSQRLDDPRSPA